MCFFPTIIPVETFTHMRTVKSTKKFQAAINYVIRNVPAARTLTWNLIRSSVTPSSNQRWPLHASTYVKAAHFSADQ